MSRFFIPTDSIDGDSILITGSDAHHISHVLRMAKGDRLTVCDMGRREHECVISDFSKDTVALKVISTKDSENEPSVRVTLYQGLPKADKFEQIIQKAVELGVDRIVPVKAERSIVKVNESFGKKLERYSAIAESAAKQCGRAIIPQVSEAVSFEQMISEMKKLSLSFICYEGNEVIPIKKLLSDAIENGVGEIGFYIGPEGGLSVSETKAAKEAGIAMCGLGSRILRTETASGCVLSCIMLLSGNLG